MAAAKKSKGKIKSYDPVKKQGVIIAKKKLYNFFASDLVYEIEIDNLKKDVFVSFAPEEGKSKHYAKSIEVSGDASSVRYDLPDKFLYTRELGFDDWETLELAKEPLLCRSAESYTDAMNKLVERAKEYKANAIIDLNKFQSTKNKDQPYVCKARLAVVAKASPRGTHKKIDLIGVNQALRKNKKSGNSIAIIVVGVGMAVTLIGMVTAFMLLK